MRNRICLDKQSDVVEFVGITATLPGRIVLEGCDEDGVPCCVNARSVIGALYSMSWSELYCNADHDIYQQIKKFVI